MKELISVAVPIYNSAGTLEKCVKSILAQSYENIEIILINDGSTDNTEQVMSQLKRRYSRISCISRTHSGVSAARNTAAAQANGKYIVFTDSDDTLERDFLQKLYMHASYGVLPICGIRHISENNTVSENVYSAIGNVTELSKNSVVRLYERGLFSSTANKLYSCELIKKYAVTFPEDIANGEDLLFNLQYIKHINGFAVINEPLYNYNIKASGTLHTICEKVRFDFVNRMYNEFKANVNSFGCTENDILTLKRLILDEFLYAVRLYCMYAADGFWVKVKKIADVFASREYNEVKVCLGECLDGRLYRLFKAENALFTVIYYYLLKMRG